MIYGKRSEAGPVDPAGHVVLSSIRKKKLSTDVRQTALMPAVGLEPTRPREQQILSLPCMPFHHAGSGETCTIITRPSQYRRYFDFTA